MPPAFTHGYALLIGVDQNHVSSYALPDVAKDIQALEKVLIHPQRCAYPTDNVKTLTGQEATRQGILDGLKWLRERLQTDTADADVGSNATTVIYYTGHGIREESDGASQFYLVPCDFDDEMIDWNCLSKKNLVSINLPRLPLVATSPRPAAVARQLLVSTERKTDAKSCVSLYSTRGRI